MILGHGDDAYLYGFEPIANFSSNVRPGGVSPQLTEYLTSVLKCIEHYPRPDAYNLNETIAKFHNIDPSLILTNNGASASIYLLAGILSKGFATVFTPTFSEYEQACKSYGNNVRFCPISEAHEYTKWSNMDSVWLANPNNPDGFIWDTDFILDKIANYPNTFFVIDESYQTLSTNAVSLIDKVSEFSNFAVVRSLTKRYAIPGLRLGYIVTHPINIDKLTKYKIPWGVNQLAIKAGIYVLTHPECDVLDIDALMAERERVSNAVAQIPEWTVFPSSTNFFLVKLPEPRSKELKDYLMNTHKLLIRDCSNFKKLDEHYIRIAIQQPHENDLLINALKEWNSITK